jgi:uncharacterized cupredoxin-like copper-binding protein
MRKGSYLGTILIDIIKNSVFMKSVIAIIVMAGLTLTSYAQTTVYKAHAVFIYNFAKYSQWPTPPTEFVITVLGKSPLTAELVAGAAKHNVHGVKVVVQEVDDVSQVKATHMVVITDGKSNQLNDLIKATAAKPIMIVTEREGLFKRGAGISFFVNDSGKLNFEMNLTDMQKRSLSLSKNLTTLAATTL